MTVLGLLVVVTTGVAVPAPAAAQTGWRHEMLAAVNEVRAAAGVAPVRPCPALRRAAQAYAALMAADSFVAHEGPDGRAPGDRIRGEGYAWTALAENLAAGQRSIGEVMAAWVASPAHYANLVHPALRHVGFGHASANGGYGAYWVQEFGRGRGC